MALAGARRCVLRAAPPAGRLLRASPALRRSRASRAAPLRAAAATTHLKELRIKARAPTATPHCPPAPVFLTCAPLDHPQNFALVEEQTVVFAPGLNIITGQSGAGKSVLVRPRGAPEETGEANP